jgi:hypothetical protein
MRGVIQPRNSRNNVNHTMKSVSSARIRKSTSLLKGLSGIPSAPFGRGWDRLEFEPVGDETLEIR